MLITPMRDSEEIKPSDEQLEELEVLRHLDTRDVAAEAIRAGSEAVPADEASHAALRRRMWLGLRLALIITLGVVLIVAAWFRYKLPQDAFQDDFASDPLQSQAAESPSTDPEQVRRFQERVSQVCDWRYETDTVLSTPVVGADGTIYLINSFKYGDSQSLIALAPDGVVRWRRENSCEHYTWSLLTAANGRLIVSDYRGTLFSLATDGTEQWRVKMGGGISGAAVGSGGEALYIAAQASSQNQTHSVLHMLDIDGNELWSLALPDTVVSSRPVVHFGTHTWPGLVVAADGTVYAMGADGWMGEPTAISAISAQGELLWRHELPDVHQRQGEMYIGSQRFNPDEYVDDKVPDFESGVISYRYSERDTDDRFRCLLPAPDGGCYAVTATDAKHRGKLLAFSADSGLRWTAALDIVDFAEPLTGADGTLYACCAPKGEDGRGYQVVAVDPADGSLRWSCPVARDGRLALGLDGSLYLSARDCLWAISTAGMVRWTASKGMYFSPPHVAEDGSILLTGDFGLIAYEPDGIERFNLELAEYGPQDLALGPDGAVYLVLNDNEMVALSL